jgi:N-methylhydantoinase B
MGMSGLGSIQRGSIEEIEIRYPWRTERYHFTPDFSGAGRWRGGSGMVWEIRNLGGDARIATGSSDGDLTQPSGAAGGEPGPLSKMYIRRGDEVETVRTHRMIEVRTGEVLGKVSGGGGGVGAPFERDPEAVLQDVINNYVTIEAAEGVYGVAIDPTTNMIDEERTKRLRGIA